MPSWSAPATACSHCPWLGANPSKLRGADCGRFADGEIRRWAEVVKRSGAKPD